MTGCYGKGALLKAIYAYEPQNPAGSSETVELQFEVGDIITFVERDESGWAKGEHNGKIGWFPFSYVEICESQGSDIARKLSSAPQINVDRRSLLETTNEVKSHLDKYFSTKQRPEKDDLVERNIMPSQGLSPALAETARSLEKDRKKNFLKKFLGGYRKPKVGDTQTIFGQSLDSVCIRGSGTPLFICDCITYLETIDALREEGLFRKSGSFSEVERLKAMYVSPTTQVDLMAMNASPHVVASLLKQFLREMPIPLLTFELYEPLVSLYKSTHAHDVLVTEIYNLLDSLPVPNRNTLSLLIQHFNRVAERSAENMMSSNNLGIVIAPNILRSESQDSATLCDITNTQVIALMIEHGIY